jgi:flagellar basal body P-ring protein FlgI
MAASEGARDMKSRGAVVAVRLLIVSSIVVSIVGCHSSFFRGKKPDVEQFVADDEGTRLVGDLTFPSGMNYVRIEGVGLVNNLNNTGSDPRPSAERDSLIDEMQTHDAYKPQTLLSSPITSMVLVRGFLPPGVQKGDRFDLEVVVPSRSETTSLRGGWLMQTRLRELAVLNNVVRKGDVDGLGIGDVVVDAMFEDGEDSKTLTRGRVLGGGHAQVSRKLGLTIREHAASVRASSMIGNAINNRFYHYDRGTKQGVAKPMNSNYIELAVPPRYKNNVTRYMKVVRNISVGESLTDRAVRMQQLEAKLLEPTTAYGASLQLEAIGKDAVEVLRKGLQSPDLEIRFYAAESLAYLDNEQAVKVLAEAAHQERAFRWHALTALSTMDHVSAYDALTELLSHSSAETRYGAFRAMLARNSRDPIVRGETLNGSFEFHEIAAEGPPMIHFSRARRAEIVIFGYQQTMDAPIFLLAGRRIMIKRHDDQQVRVIRFDPGEEDKVLIVSNRLSQVIRAISELGGSYEDVYQAIRSAKLGGHMSARLVVDARANAFRSFARQDEGSDESSDASSGFRVQSPIPELFEDRLDRNVSDASDGDYLGDFTEPPKKKKGIMSRMTSWWSPKRSAE